MPQYGYLKHDEMSDYAIAHYGIKGQKWGVRRYQNPDGSLTQAGKKRYWYSRNPDKRPKMFGDSSYKKYANVKINKDFNFKDESKKLMNNIIQNNKKYGMKKVDLKTYTFEDVENYFYKNYKDFNNLDEHSKITLMDKIAKELDKNGFYFTD